MENKYYKDGGIGSYKENGTRSFVQTYTHDEVSIDFIDEKAEVRTEFIRLRIGTNEGQQIIMLENGKYPYVLKRRVRGERGHLSNAQAHDFIIDSNLNDKTIYFIHVSQNNNSIEKLNEMVSTLPLNNRYIICERGKSYWE